MANVNLNIRIDESLKKQFEKFCDEIGMSMTTAFTVFAKKTVRENKIPFELGFDIPNKETLEAINEVELMMNDPSMGKTYDNVDDMMEDLVGDV